MNKPRSSNLSPETAWNKSCICTLNLFVLLLNAIFDYQLYWHPPANWLCLPWEPKSFNTWRAEASSPQQASPFTLSHVNYSNVFVIEIEAQWQFFKLNYNNPLSSRNAFNCHLTIILIGDKLLSGEAAHPLFTVSNKKYLQLHRDDREQQTQREYLRWGWYQLMLRGNILSLCPESNVFEDTQNNWPNTRTSPYESKKVTVRCEIEILLHEFPSCLQISSTLASINMIPPTDGTWHNKNYAEVPRFHNRRWTLDSRLWLQGE